MFFPQENQHHVVKEFRGFLYELSEFYKNLKFLQYLAIAAFYCSAAQPMDNSVIKGVHFSYSIFFCPILSFSPKF